jgi:hypothetical protein
MARAGRRRLLAATLSASIVVANGCGGSPKPLTRAQLLARADAVCRRVNKRLSSVTIKTQKDLVRVLPKVAGYEQQSLAELSKLIPPASLADDWKTIITGAQTIADNTAKLTEAARTKDLKTVHVLLSEVGKVQQHTTAIAKRDGFKDCSQAA